jgi:hypothetical protein
MSSSTLSRAMIGLTVLGLSLVGPTLAEAKNCRRLCRKDIAYYRQRVCTEYQGAIRRACRREVQKDILGWCKDEERKDICASILD